jgi:hypothetical protein
MTTTFAVEPTPVATLERYARLAGIAMLLSMIFGFLGEMYWPGRIIVAGNATATAANITGHPMLVRLAFAAYLVERICDITLCVFFYVLLKPVDRNLALLSAFFGMASMITFAVSEASFYSASVVLRESGGMTSFTVSSVERQSWLTFIPGETNPLTPPDRFHALAAHRTLRSVPRNLRHVARTLRTGGGVCDTSRPRAVDLDLALRGQG